MGLLKHEEFGSPNPTHVEILSLIVVCCPHCRFRTHSMTQTLNPSQNATYRILNVILASFLTTWKNLIIHVHLHLSVSFWSTTNLTVVETLGSIAPFEKVFAIPPSFISTSQCVSFDASTIVSLKKMNCLIGG